MATSKIKVRDLNVTFESANGEPFPVLRDINFDVMDNEILVLLGPGQCGTTVLLNMIAGLDDRYDGTINFSDKREVGMVFQKYALYGWKTVLGNVESSLKYQGVDKKKRHEIAKKYIELVGLQGFENKYPAQLSGGMKQRVGIARAYASGRDIILMDEPFGALDAQTRYQMQEEILKIKEHEKSTIIFVTNNIEEALYLGDRILLFSNRPSSIVKEYVPDIPHPRKLTSHEFMKLRQEITDNMDMTL